MRRVARSVITGLISASVVALLVFLALRVVPGDPVELMLGESAAPASRQALRVQLGLDQPLADQLGRYARNLTHGELGDSLVRHRPVTRLIAESFPFTLGLACCAALLANVLGVPLGVFAAHRPRAPLSRALFGVALIFSALPAFWLGPLLVVLLGLRWPWLPVSSYESAASLVLPTLAMGCGLAATVFQTTRAAVSERLAADYIRTAHAKGAGPWRVLFRHALPNAAAPILTVSALQFGHLLAGAAITETIFDWPGLGLLMYDSLLTRDYPTIQGAVLVISLIYVGLNMATDALVERRMQSREAAP